jgi:hypothetical protein
MKTQRNMEGDGVSPWPQYSYVVTKIASSLIVIKISVVQYGTFTEACHIRVWHDFYRLAAQCGL